jgi:hypothetical protein
MEDAQHAAAKALVIVDDVYGGRGASLIIDVQQVRKGWIDQRRDHH